MTHDEYIPDEAVAVPIVGAPARDTSAWTIPLMCVGIATIACCILIPAADENRRLQAETAHLQADLDQIKHQTAVNDQFLKSVADDPTLLERLAQRQMKMIRSGETVLNLKGEDSRPEMSPYLLTDLPPPAMATMPAPGNTALDKLSSQPRLRLFAMGGALLLMAAGLVLGVSTPRESI
jgi:hypothetical protein